MDFSNECNYCTSIKISAPISQLLHQISVCARIIQCTQLYYGHARPTKYNIIFPDGTHVCVCGCVYNIYVQYVRRRLEPGSRFGHVWPTQSDWRFWILFLINPRCLQIWLDLIKRLLLYNMCVRVCVMCTHIYIYHRCVLLKIIFSLFPRNSEGEYYNSPTVRMSRHFGIGFFIELIY